MIPVTRRLPWAMLSAALLVLPSALNAQPAAWGRPAWAHRMEFTAKADSVPPSGTLADFPLLLSLDAAQAQVFSRAKADGSDLLVTAGDGTTVLDREIVGYDAGAMEAEIWIRGALSQAGRRFYLYYDHPGTTLVAASPGTWTAPYRAVYHFDDDPGGGVLTDSSPAGADIALVAARGWTSSDTTRAQIRQGWFFNGTTHHLATKSISTQDSSYVISTWLLNVESAVDFALQANPDYWHISSQVNSTAPQPDYALSTGYVRWYPRPIPLNAGYHLFTWVFNAATFSVKFYFDGEPQNVYLGSTYYPGRRINPLQNEPVGVLGPIYYNSDDIMKGGADEFRIREGVVSADWIRTEYRNQRDPQGFYDFGSEEARDVTAVGPRTDPAAGLFLAQNTPNPFQSRTAIRFSLERAGTVRLAVYSVAGRRIAGLIDAPLGPGTYETAWDGRTRAGLNAPSGVYFLRLEMNGAARTVKLQLRR